MASRGVKGATTRPKACACHGIRACVRACVRVSVCPQVSIPPAAALSLVPLSLSLPRSPHSPLLKRPFSRPLLLEIISFLGVSGNGQWAASYGELPICTLQLRFATTPPQDLRYVPVHYSGRSLARSGGLGQGSLLILDPLTEGAFKNRAHDQPGRRVVVERAENAKKNPHFCTFSTTFFRAHHPKSAPTGAARVHQPQGGRIRGISRSGCARRA